ncbi:Iron-sulfur cluster assembly accessory protein [Chlamydiales bacterium STE3]|nr:Iron-sulfur cluster assembly accessory protein [Chlamydiales bacterium STE3]
MAEKTIHPQMTISEILSGFPQYTQRLAQEITNAGLHCVGCGAAHVETLEAGMKGHGRTDEQINDLVNKLNVILNETVDLSTITLTPQAAEQFLFFAQQEGKAGYGLRFGEQLAGCSGFEYILDFSEKATPNDEVFVSQGVEIHVEKALLNRLKGCKIDFTKGLNDSGFKVINPNAGSSCGCGSSHGYK